MPTVGNFGVNLNAKMRAQKFILIVGGLLLFHAQAKATHLRAGEITVSRESCSSLTFTVTITVFTDLTSSVKFG
ncbi:MAG: hypothetical protein CRN43_15085, partial [Candidatus Nephrothrix sp. EaCA]